MQYAAGRRSKFLVALLMILFAGGLASQSGKLEEVQKSDTAEFLPGGAESVLALERSREFPSGQTSPAVVVVARGERQFDGADRTFIAELSDFLDQADFPRAADAGGPPPRIEAQAAAMTVPLDGTDSDEVAAAVEAMRDWLAAEAPRDLEVAVTGPAAFSTDLKNVFTGADTKLLMVAGGLVFFLLILIYRSPIFWLIPFFTVLLAEGGSRGLAALLGEAGLTINGENAGILSVLVFGAATDYALLLVARYREELHRHRDRHEAMSVALRGATPAILASGGTVIAGLLTLLVADVDSTRSIGPLGAAGIGLALLFSLTVLPATLLIAGRHAFWPFIPRYSAEVEPGQARRFWPALGRKVSSRPRPLWIGSVLLLVVLSFGLTGADTTLTQEEQLRGEPEAVTGQALLAEYFPAGSTAPASVVAPDRQAADEISSVLAAEPELVGAVLGVEQGPPGAQLTVVLASDPFGEEAVAAIPAIRTLVHAVAPEALVGGPTAQSYDLREAAERDNLVVPPLTLLVVLIVLIILLRAVLAPVLLLAATALSAAAALGAGVLIFDHILGLPALDPTLPLLAFVFLVALGVDYTIFLMARTREETEDHGTRQGVIRALVTTGGVITSAGIVLAGTFSALAILPLVILTQLGVVVAFGVMLDTMLVRSILVPALVTDIGPRIWWPRRSP